MRRLIISAVAALVLAGAPGLASASTTATAGPHHCGKPDVSVTHNRTSTTAHINFNPCSRWWIWPWASFIDQDGNPDRDSVPGVKHGNPVVQEPGARKNVLGGYGYSDSSGQITNVQTYG
jgi:hypothetical protein